MTAVAERLPQPVADGAADERGVAGRAALRLPRLSRLDPLASTAWALMVNTVVTSVLGMAFWAVASRFYSAGDLGRSAALISAMMLLSVISQLNLAMGISRLLPQVRRERWRPVAGAYGLSAGAGLVVAAGFALFAPRLSGSFDFLGQDAALAAALVVAVILWNVFALQDAVLTAARWAAAVPVENGVFGLLKIGLMIALASSFGGQGIFWAWALAMAIMLLPVNGLIFAKVLPAGARSPSPAPAEATVLPLGDRRRVTRYLAGDYVAALLNQGYTAMLPLLVVGVLGGDANAYFYIAFVIAGAVRAVAQSMSTSLVVEGAHDESQLVSLTRLSVVRYVKYAVPATVALVAAAPLLLLPFGGAYVDRGTTLLRLLLVATVPQAAIALYLGVERVRARVSRVLAMEALIVVLVTAGAIAGMHAYGLVGVGVAWLAAQSAVAVLVLPALARAWRPPAPEPERRPPAPEPTRRPPAPEPERRPPAPEPERRPPAPRVRSAA